MHHWGRKSRQWRARHHKPAGGRRLLLEGRCIARDRHATCPAGPGDVNCGCLPVCNLARDVQYVTNVHRVRLNQGTCGFWCRVPERVATCVKKQMPKLTDGTNARYCEPTAPARLPLLQPHTCSAYQEVYLGPPRAPACCAHQHDILTRFDTILCSRSHGGQPVASRDPAALSVIGAPAAPAGKLGTMRWPDLTVWVVQVAMVAVVVTIAPKKGSTQLMYR